MIRLDIKCNNIQEVDPALRNLGLEEPANKLEYRPLSLRWAHVSGFYPNLDGGCFIFIGDIEINVKQSFEELVEIDKSYEQ